MEAGRACVVLVNKWDLVSNKDDLLYRNSGKYLGARLPQLSWAKSLYVSAKTGLRTADVFKAVTSAAEQHRRRVTTAIMNEVLEDGVRWQKPPSTSTGRQGSIYYCAQVSTAPPTIAIFVNDPDLFSETYRRYLEGHFRKSLGFEGSPIRCCDARPAWILPWLLPRVHSQLARNQRSACVDAYQALIPGLPAPPAGPT